MIYSMPWWAILLVALAIGGLAAGIAWFFTHDGFDGGPMIPSLALVFIGGLAFAIPMAIRESHAYDVWCREQGGRVDSHTSTSVVPVVNANGSVGVGTATNTTTYCLTPDGRIIDIQ